MNLGKYEGNIVSVINYSDPIWNEKEILRWYFGRKNVDIDDDTVLNEAKINSKKVLTYKICYAVTPIRIENQTVIFPFGKAESKSLSKNLSECKIAVVFAATIGIGLDKLIEKYNKISMSKALCYQSIGNERVETLCDTFNNDIVTEIKNLNDGLNIYSRPRFSPGYGDLNLNFQKDIFNFLKCNKNIGVTLNDSLLMSPSKSVTAIIGIGEEI